MRSYHHLTAEERESLMLFQNQGQSIRQIARQLGRSPSTISRELRRNVTPYRATRAQAHYQQSRKNSRRHRILEDRELHKLVHFLLGTLFWSPEQIAARLQIEGTANISASTIYRALDNGLLQDTLRFYLRIKYKKIGKAKKKNRSCYEKSISLRPVEAALRCEDGHLEGDLILSSREKDALVTLVDRKSRYPLCMKIPNKEAITVRDAVIQMLQTARIPVKSITFDRGTEFSEAKAMEQALGIPVYFAHPHAPWERPTSENTNGLIRQFIPKRRKISELTDEDISRIQTLLVFRPRKCLAWRTPYECAFEKVLHFT